MKTKPAKPLGIRAYGSIGHLPSSRLGPGDHSVHAGQARICTEKVRDKNDRIIVQEKLDGSCTAVALVGGEIIALQRAGYPAESSPYPLHHQFARWVRANECRFRRVLREGERLCGEWLALAHGTLYDLAAYEPWAAFDLMSGHTRQTYDSFVRRIDGIFQVPHLLHHGSAISITDAMDIHRRMQFPCDEPEGVVYRVERNKRVEFLAKWVRPDKVDGKHLPEISGKPAVWNWKEVSEP